MKKLALFLCILFCISLFTFGASAQEIAPISAEVESPSLWAQFEVYMSLAYQLGSLADYANYTGALTSEKLSSVHGSLSANFGVSDELKIANPEMVTRGEAINEFYDIIIAALGMERSDSENAPLDYFVENGLLAGRGTGNYALDAVCQNQELLALAQRTYSHIIYRQGKESKGFLWKISDADNSVFLLGSIHMTDGSVFPLSWNILLPYVQSANLVVEANILNIDMEQVDYMNYVGMIHDEKTIRDYISEETYTVYAAICEQIGLPAELYDKLMPWYAATSLQSVLYQANSANNSSFGIDYYFLLMSAYMYPEKGVLELESIKEQADMLASFSPELQEYLLYTTVNPVTDVEISAEDLAYASGEYLSEMVKLWVEGDEVGIQPYLSTEKTGDALIDEYYDKLNTQRNIAMIDKVDNYLSGGTQDYFVVVGLLHLLNDEGIVKALADKGYTVERIR